VIDDTHRAWAYLSRVAEPPCPELSAVVAQVGPMEAAQRIRSGMVDERLVRHTDARCHLDCAAADLALLAGMGGRLITADDEECPGLSFAAFGGVDTKARPQGHAPLVLWALGPALLFDAALRSAASRSRPSRDHHRFRRAR
jgi:DNA processing protein